MIESKRNITDLVPDTWFKDTEKSSFWVTGYQICCPEALELKQGHSFDLEQVRVLIFKGEINYPKIKGAPIVRVRDNRLCIEGVKYDHLTESTTWLLILQPYIVDGEEREEYLVKRKAGSIAALYVAINGFNMAYTRVFDFQSTLSGEVSCASPTFINPGAFPLPDLSEKRLQSIHMVGQAIDGLDTGEKRRVEIALHWFESGLRSQGLDAFIKLWVAIETLAMPDGSNIKPLNQRLADLYGMSLSEASTKFGVGIIFGLRSRILHGGEDLAINQSLSQYMEALFFDIILSVLNLHPGEGRALSICNDPDFDIRKMTHT
jgi:hypothetical protein